MYVWCVRFRVLKLLRLSNYTRTSAWLARVCARAPAFQRWRPRVSIGCLSLLNCSSVTYLINVKASYEMNRTHRRTPFSLAVERFFPLMILIILFFVFLLRIRLTSFVVDTRARVANLIRGRRPVISGVPIGGKTSVSPTQVTHVVNVRTQSPCYIGRTRVDSKNVILILVFTLLKKNYCADNMLGR